MESPLTRPFDSRVRGILGFMAYASSHMRKRARALRHAPTRAEDRLWSCLRDRRFTGYKFGRQVPIGPYVVDFYCAAIRLAIELDGAQHHELAMLDYENRRTDFLNSRGIEVCRIRNEVLIRDPQLVGEIIQCAIDERAQWVR